MRPVKLQCLSFRAASWAACWDKCLPKYLRDRSIRAAASSSLLVYE